MRSPKPSPVATTSLLVILALIGGLAGCTSESTTPPDLSLPSTTSPTTTLTTTAPPGKPVELGSTEVGTVINLPLITVDWTWTPLDMGDPDAVEPWLNHVSIIGDHFVAVAFAWNAPPDNQTVYTWTSTNADEWVRTELEIPQGEVMHSISVTGGTLVGLGQQTVSGAMYPKLWRFDADEGWTTMEFETPGIDLRDVNIYGVAANEAGTLLGAGLDVYRTDEPIAFEAKGFRFELDDIEGRFEVTEADTGRLVTAGRWADLYRWSEEGQAIYVTETAALITIVPWEVWDGIYPTYSPLPIPVVAAGEISSSQSIEWDGYEVTVDDSQDLFVVTQNAQVVTEGRLQDLYRGPSPSFKDPATDELAVSFTWDEWDNVVNAAYEGYKGESHVRHESQQLILFSADGKTWSRRILSEDQNTHLESVATVGNTFVVNLVEHFDYGVRRSVFLSADGIEWEQIETTGPEYADVIRQGPHGLIAISWGANEPAVATSDDGIDWTTTLTLGPQNDNREGWLRLVASGDLGRAALATLSQAPPYENLRITVGDQTAEFGGLEWALRITETLSGEVLLEAGWSEIEEAYSLGDPRFASYEDGATTLFSRDGVVLMVITDQLAFEAMEEQAASNQAQVDHVLFLEVEGAWHEVEFPDDKTPEALAVGTDVIVVGTMTYPPYSAISPMTNQLGILTGKLQ